MAWSVKRMPMSGNDSTHIPTKTVRHNGTAFGRHRIKGCRIGLEHPRPAEKAGQNGKRML